MTTHHHFDHTAGLRAAIAEGLTVITHEGNKAWVETMAGRPHTRQPDALAKNAKNVKVETVGADRVVKDATMEVDLYHVAGNPHSDTMLMAYLPKARLLVEVDAFSPGSARAAVRGQLDREHHQAQAARRSHRPTARRDRAVRGVDEDADSEDEDELSRGNPMILRCGDL